MKAQLCSGILMVFAVLAADLRAEAKWAAETVSLGVGLEEILDGQGRRPVYAAEVGFTEWAAGLTPVVELNVSAAGATFAGLGLAWRWEAEALPIGLRVGVAPGYYERGRDKFLGGNFQVFSFVEASWRVTDTQSVGLRLAHLSNASTADINPGTEILGLVYEFKLAR